MNSTIYETNELTMGSNLPSSLTNSCKGVSNIRPTRNEDCCCAPILGSIRVLAHRAGSRIVTFEDLVAMLPSLVSKSTRRGVRVLLFLLLLAPVAQSERLPIKIY